VRVDDRVVVVHATAPRDAFLVLSDTYYPGWRASIDGVPVPLYRTNACIRGVALPAGTHEVRFAFEPVSFRVGAGLSLASLSVLAVVLFRGRSQSARRTD
jgi:uncharacterized membrane protein YfhO